jgi:Leucine-rich repeat (LRR) protein
LRQLDIAYNKITTVEPLRNLTKLESLSIAGNNIRKLEPLSRLVNLNSLYLGTSCAGGNPVTDFGVLKNFVNLQTLDMEYMKLKKIDFVAELKQLQWLSIKNNSITNIEPLRGLTNLKYLYLANNSISDFSPVYDIVYNMSDTDIKID